MLRTVFNQIIARCPYVFQNYCENLLLKYASNKGTLKERVAEHFMRGLLMMLMQYLLLIAFIKAYAVGTHLNCLDLSTHNICFYIKK